MAKKVGKQIKDDLLRYLAFIQESLDRELVEEIGIAVTVAMLQMIEKGISPIEGAGRFPAYKWASFSRDVKKANSFTRRQVREIRAQARKAAKGGNKKRARSLRENASALSGFAKMASGVASSKYPFNTKEYKRGTKRPRPVNLLLTGSFLKALEYKLTGTAGKYGLEIGFFDAKEALKEEGHREGANGQPKRPIIPVLREEFAQTIQNEIWKRIELAIDRAAAKGQ